MAGCAQLVGKVTPGVLRRALVVVVSHWDADVYGCRSARPYFGAPNN